MVSELIGADGSGNKFMSAYCSVVCTMVESYIQQIKDNNN